MEHLTCEICGGNILAKSGGIFVCTGCGMHYDRERIQEMAAQCHQASAEKSPESPKVASPFPVPQKKGFLKKWGSALVLPWPLQPPC